MKIVPPSALLQWITPNPEQVIERAGRTCYKSESTFTPETSAKFIRMIIERGHESVIEHAVASFLVVCDRGISHEIVRHRLASYSQESTRYCNYANDRFAGEISVVEPPGLSPGQLDDWRVSCENAEFSYLRMIDQGVSPQIARSVLPTCLKTEIVITANLREWRHILRLRLSPAAHPQIRSLMGMVADVLIRVCPNVFHDFEHREE
jgi:thymidylate synthase (FAD)